MRRADGATPGVSCGIIAGILRTLGGVAVEGKVAGGDTLRLDVGRLRPLRKKESVDGARAATGTEVTRCKVFLLVGVTTLGAAACGGDGDVAVALVLENISARCRSADSWASFIGANGVLGCGFFRAAVRSRAASMAASAEEVVGISYR